MILFQMIIIGRGGARVLGLGVEKYCDAASIFFSLAQNSDVKIITMHVVRVYLLSSYMTDL